MRPGARVDEQRIGELGRLMKALDELALEFVELDLEAELPRPVPDPHLELDKGQGAVVLALALSELVEVDAVEDLDTGTEACHAFPASRPHLHAPDLLDRLPQESSETL